MSADPQDDFDAACDPWTVREVALSAVTIVVGLPVVAVARRVQRLRQRARTWPLDSNTLAGLTNEQIDEVLR